MWFRLAADKWISPQFRGRVGGTVVVRFRVEGIRDLLKRSLGQSLSSLRDEDKLAAAWPVACGKAMAEKGTVVGYVDGIVRVQVEDVAWLRQLMSMRGQLAAEMARIAGIRVSEIHFERKR
jgi:Dna[CI] antecedent, DciA